MSYFYVKNSLGTRTTGGGLTKQTGSFTSLGAASVYAKIEDAITDGATSGDFICVSDAHQYSATSAHITYSGPTTGGDFLYIISVDDANCDTYSKATAYQEKTATASYDIGVSSGIFMYGIYLETADQITLTYSMYFYECTFYHTNVSYINVNGDGIGAVFRSCVFSPAANNYMQISGGSVVQLFGCTVNWTTSLTWQGYGNGGGTIIAKGCDLSSISGSVINSAGSYYSGDDAIQAHIIGCKLHASASFANEDLLSINQRVHASNSSDSSAAAEYQIHLTARGGVLNDETSFYRDGSTAFPSATKISLKCVTNTYATRSSPFWFDMPSRYSALSSTSTDKISIYLLTSATLYDSDVWAELVYPDGTNKQLYTFLSTMHGNVLDTNGTGLTANTETWTGRTTENRYQIDLDTSGDAGADCVPIIRVYVAKASSTIYFCPTLGLS